MLLANLLKEQPDSKPVSSQLSNLFKQTQTPSKTNNETNIANKENDPSTYPQWSPITPTQGNSKEWPCSTPIPDKSSEKLRFCSKHPTQLEDFICMDEQCLVCAYCGLSKNHRGHNIVSVSEFRIEANTVLTRYQEKIDELDKYPQCISKVIQKSNRAIKHRINEAFDGIVRQVNKQRNRMLGKADHFFSYSRYKKIKTESYCHHTKTRGEFWKKFQTLKSDEFDSQFFEALKGPEEVTISLKSDYEELVKNCERLPDTLEEKFYEHNFRISNAIHDMQDIQINFEFGTQQTSLPSLINSSWPLNKMPVLLCDVKCDEGRARQVDLYYDPRNIKLPEYDIMQPNNSE